MKRKDKNNLTKQFFFLLFLLLVLPILVLATQVVVKLIGKAIGTPANIIVDYNSNLGPLPKIWQALAQGGEEKGQMLSSVINDIRSLAPQYIRIDHLYDMYDVVKNDGSGKIYYDFSKLDLTVNDILKTGALPFFSLSYMPPDLAGNVTDKPKNWNQWRDLVKATVEHYSGRNPGNKNLRGIYYEVWNEPDLFGRWKTYGDKNYLELYRETVLGALSARNVNDFKIGGPATTGMYPDWMKSLLRYNRDNNIRLDFLSYHRYTINPSIFSQDLISLKEILAQYPRFNNLPVIISEWSLDSQNNSLYDTNFAAIHTIASIRQMLNKANMVFSFEIKDGPSDKEYWGRWGIITHDKFGLHKKPRYYALKFLNKMAGQRIIVSGEGSWVTGFAATEEELLKIILVNFDQEQRHSENVPLTINNLPLGNYSFKTNFLFGSQKQEIIKTNNGVINTNIFMPVQSAVYLELQKVAPEYSFVPGYFNESGNFALLLDKTSLPLEFSKKEFELKDTGTIDFFLKPQWDEDEELTVFNIPLSEGQNFSLKKRNVGFGKRLEFGIFANNDLPKQTVFASISSWQKGQWHQVGLTWGKKGLSISLDGQKIQSSEAAFWFSLAGNLTFNNFGGAIDELKILDKEGNMVLLRHFDGEVGK